MRARWMERALKTGIHALERFVRTLKQDLSAVEAAVTEPRSNGPVEGHINRLKMLKRQMYGRAGVELLRARLLPESVFSSQSLHQNLSQSRFTCSDAAAVRDSSAVKRPSGEKSAIIVQRDTHRMCAIRGGLSSAEAGFALTLLSSIGLCHLLYLLFSHWHPSQ
jgi:transposase